MATTSSLRSKPVVDTLNSHVSIREYTDRPVPDDMLQEILNAARRSPTSSNLQAYSFVVVRDKETKKEIAKLAGNQKHIETCDTFVAICADVHRLEVACNMHGTSYAKNLESSMVAIVDAAIAGMSLSTAAESFGLGTVMIGGMRNHPKAVANLLQFPPGVFVVYGLCIGWPESEKIRPQKPRFEEDVVIHNEKYSDIDLRNKISRYNLQLQSYYSDQGRETPAAAWSGIIARRFSKGRRPELRETLESLGYSFE